MPRSREVSLRQKGRKGSNGERLSTPRHGEILPPGATRRPRLWLVIVGVPGWAVVAFVFWKALEQPSEFIFPLAVWIGCLLVVGLGTLVWSRYARRAKVVARKRAATGRGEGRSIEELLLTEDALGREIRLEEGASEARVVMVRVEGTTKSLRAEEREWNS